MRRDPLSVFFHEKTAGIDAAAPSMDVGPRPVTKDPDPQSLDPGERAIAGLMAAGSSIAAKVLPWVGTTLLRGPAESGSVPWSNAAPISGASSVAEMAERKMLPEHKVLGLFNVKGRVHPIQTEAEAQEFRGAVRKLGEIQGVVDSFIDKHNLAEKGVRINLSRGPISSMLGAGYNIASKEVNLPRVGKEIALHELGHAADYTAGRIGRMRGVLEPILQKGVLTALPIALVAGDRIKEMLPGTIDDKAISFMQDHAPAIMGATLAATQLYPEAKASALAIRHIHQTEGAEAAMTAFKKLAPAWGTYLLGAIPAVVGMALARKYMRQARDEKQQVRSHVDDMMRNLEKTSGMIGDTIHGIGVAAKDIGFVGRQIGAQTVDLVRHPGTVRRIGAAAKEIGTSPEFIYGALSAAVPATLGSLYLYGTPAGKHIRQRIHSEHLTNAMTGKKRVPLIRHASDEWREQNPYRFAGLVALGAAMSGGILSKFMTDLQRVL